MEQFIFGAQGIALGTYIAMKTLYPETKTECFLVSSMAGNPQILAGVPVRELRQFASELSNERKKDTKVLIATPYNVMEEIEESLRECGLSNYVKLDSIKWAELQEKAFLKSGNFTPLSIFTAGEEKAEAEVFRMVHYKDKPLEHAFSYQGYFSTLQVGAAISDKRISDIADNQSDNISEKNGDYSEMTGLYWVWKNRIQTDALKEERYYGLAHYRRFLDLSDEDMKRLKSNDIDVVLPYPMPYEPNIEEHHLRYLSNSEWNSVLQALEELEPEYSKAFSDILQQEYLYNYNVIVAKKSVLNGYCSWLFPLLFRIEEINNPDGSKKPNRYIGYIGETLETLYFMYNKGRLKIAHTGCRFLT